MKKWNIHQPVDTATQKICTQSDLSALCASVLSSRGIENVQQAAAFLQCDGLSDPFLTADMEEAADIINLALENGTKICVYGDYDCDGITATAILYTYLLEMGSNVTYRIPEREEGYGLNQAAISTLHEDGVELLITVDNGITAIEETAYAVSLGMQVIITDHHQPLKTLPDATAILDPHRSDDTTPYKYLCGAGVALRLIAALDGGDATMAMEQFGDLTAIATVADVVELTGENRYIVEQGLRLLKNTERPGLLALMEKCQMLEKAITASDVAFRIAPRINASGRMGSPMTALHLLLSEDMEEAEQLAQQLEQYNNARKEQEQSIYEDILQQVQDDPTLLQQRVLLFAGDDWHHGTIGIVASKIQERFGKPTILIAKEGEMSRGSMRSFGSFSAFACLNDCHKLLTRYGGHPKAGGFSLETNQITQFRKAVETYAQTYHPDMPIFTVEVDRLLLPDDITLDNIRSLSVLAPFGEGNPEPIFLLHQATLQSIVPLSKGLHTKLRISYGKKFLELLLFHTRPEEVGLKTGEYCDFLVTAEVSTYQHQPQITLLVKDYRKSGIKQAAYFSAMQTYEKYCRHEPLSEAYWTAIVPSREDCVAVYQRIPAEGCTWDTLFYTLQDIKKMNYCKMRLILDIFSELALVKQDAWLQQVSRVPVTQKVDLQSSVLLQKLQKKE